ncbi:Dynamin N-terminal domain-containing protein [Madurella fahalii]|uniref:Dynamin N-terminal domain-containing protein n=1 Tax=Madurella fahalii TaxID=1157608 RepID=A0ABQ0GG28_9PEZI
MAPVKTEPQDNAGLGPCRVPPKTEDGEKKVGIRYLQQLVSESSPERLEKGVTIGLQVLRDLKEPLEACAQLTTTQAAQWLKSIGNLEARARPPRTIVGVVGNTGAGKSSVISAVLDEERLLPTNCMRACTASPTEISYNDSENPDELYRAEVEFITRDDWVKELHALFSDLLDGNGEVSRECTNQDSDCGVAYAKIKAVYPKMTRDMIASATPESLANVGVVRGVLGTVKKLRATTAASLYRQLQTYVDSKEKNTDRNMEYWPLIKVVRIYTKASALATGACLVDLPGVQDSNAARAAVAANYMKACTGLWIVAPITRAVDDKTARSLLGDSFRRQLKYDGTYSAVTFICSKTDDISVTEAAESLGIEEEISESWSAVQALSNDIRRFKSEIASLRDERDACDELIDEIEQTWDEWDALASKLSDGVVVYAPSSPNKKRKRRSKPRGSRKNRSSSDTDDSDFSDTDVSDCSDKENQALQDEDRVPLTEEQIEAKLTSLKAKKKEIRAKKKQIEEQVSEHRNTIKNLAAEKDTLLAEVKAVCIQGRNAYSKRAIKQDFAMGIKELDQETAAEKDEENFDPEADLRDYGAVAESLPVFCVSSRAFQKLSGRLQKDDVNSAGFQSVEDTEIPQLQAHARKLTESGRAANSRRFLNDLLQLLNSMSMWATDDGTRLNWSDAEQRSEEIRLRNQLKRLEEELESSLIACITSMKQQLAENVFEKFDQYIPKAIDDAVPTATQWGAPRDMGGLLWATYKATCRRNGIFSGSSGPRDFNEELFAPISKHLASGWERAFQRRLPSCLDDFLREVRARLTAFHREATEGASGRGDNYNGLNMLSQQLQAHSQRVSGIRDVLMALAQDLQRDANRAFTPVIQSEMTQAYEGCFAERGTGSFKRMKDIMISHVTTHRQSMFRNATSVVQTQLEDMCRRIKLQMEEFIQDIHARLTCDYLSVLVGADVSGGVSRVERMLRAEIVPLLAKADLPFAELVSEPAGHEGHVGAQLHDRLEGRTKFRGGDDDDLGQKNDAVETEVGSAAHDSITVKAENLW